MNKIIFPLKLRMKNSNVADLQIALQLFLDRNIILRDDEDAKKELSAELKGEHIKQTYGKITHKLVSIFQEEQKLEVSGTVDEPTAKAINIILRKLGMFEQQSESRSFVVSGRVQFEDGLTLKGGIVRAFHETKSSMIRLGEDTTDAKGHYTIRYNMLPEVPGINMRISVSDEEGTLLQSSDLIQNAKSLETIDLTVPLIREPAKQRRIEGTIALENGLLANKIKLRLYNHDFGSDETLLSEVTTRDDGLYALSYDVGDKAVTSLDIRAVDAEGKETPLSKVMHDLGKVERAHVNLVAPASLQPLAAEYQQMTADLTPHVVEMKKLVDSQENSERQDLTLLNRATGWDARLIALASKAAKLSMDADVGLSQEVIYGMFRAGLPSDKMQLAQVSEETVDQALTKVKEAGIINLSDQQVVEVKKKFGKFALKTRLSVPAPGSRSTYGNLLKTTGLKKDKRTKFASVYLNHRGDPDQLWEKAAEAGIGPKDIQVLQLQGKLAFLTRNSEDMTTRLQKDMGISDPVELVGQGFYQPEKWKAEIRALAGNDEEKLNELIPPAYEAENVEDRLNAYSEDTARKVRVSYPTQVVEHMVEQDAADEFKLGTNRAATTALLKNVATRGFRLGQTPVESFVRDHPEVLNGIDTNAIESAKQGLKTLQRVYQITPGNEAMPILLSLGLTSAYDIVDLSQEVFLDRYGHKFPSPEQARLVYRKAQQVSSVTYNLFTIAKKLDSESPVYGISAPVEVRESVKNELIKQFPTMESLFGSMDFCECEHCRSVLSPAAYLVDLLQFVDAEPQVWDKFLADWKDKHNDQDYTAEYKKPYDSLIERRPDLPHISLTCENTNTALPYIDMVNEILEYYVANEKLDDKAAHDTGESTTAELLAEPQNVVAEAYDKLQKAHYPLNLPFDLWIETARQFCDYFETPLWQLLEAFRKDDKLFVPSQSYDRTSIFIESIGISPAEYAIFTDSNLLNQLYDLYGYATARPAIGSPTNITNATVGIPDADALNFKIGDQCTYFNISTNAPHTEMKMISEIGVAGSGGAGQTIITFTGIWNTAPVVGDLLVFAALAALKSAKTLSKQLGVTYKELVEIVQTGFVNPKLAELVILHKLSMTVQDVLFYRDRKTFYEQNKDLLGKDRSTLPTAEQQRFDALSKDDWKDLSEVQAFEKRLDDLSVKFQTSGFDAKNWLNTALQNNTFNDILMLADSDASCNFDQTILRYANGQAADAIAFLKINMFVRLWRKLGWTIEETDRALQVFMPKNAPFDVAHLGQSPLKTALIYMAHLKELDEQVRVGKQSRMKLITLWSDLTTTGKKPLYEQIFLRHNMLKSDAIFDDALGQYLSPTVLAAMAQSQKHEVKLENVPPADKIDPTLFAGHPKVTLFYDAFEEVQSLAYLGELTDEDKVQLAALSPSPALAPLLDAVQTKAKEFMLIKGHMLALQGGLGLTYDDIDRILTDKGLSIENAPLSLANVSLLYRYGLLAKPLKLSVRELIALKHLSGLDPFKQLHPDQLSKLEDDYPFTHTLRFVEIAGYVKKSGLKIEDLDYLLRHNIEDPVGKYRPNSEDMLVLIKTLAEGIRTIRAEHAVPEDAGSMSKEVLRQKLGLALPPDVVERFLAMMNQTVEFTATRTGVQPENQLKPEEFTDEPSIREISYNDKDPRKSQKLTFRGVLFDEEKNKLKSSLPKPMPPDPHIPSPLFGDLLDDIQEQARSFFVKNLQKQAQDIQPEAGFLEAADFDLLFAPTPADFDETDKQELLRQQRTRLAQAFLPFLQQRLIRQFIVQTLTAHMEMDPVLVESLLTDARLLGTLQPAGTPQPLLAAFTTTSERGLTATFFASPDGSGAPLATSAFSDADTGLKDKDGNALKPPGTNSARFEGYLEVPAHGAYRFYVALDRQNTEAELRFDHLPDPLFLSGIAANNEAEISEYLELKPGVPYRFSLTLRELNSGEARLMVQGETLPKDSLVQLTLYPLTAIERGEHAMILLNKTLQLSQSLNLNEREMRYLLTHAADFDNLNLSKLPTRESDDSTDGARALFTQFLRLAEYARLKRDLAGSTDDLIGVFESNEVSDMDKVYQLIAKLTRRDEVTVKSTANALSTTPAFANDVAVQRLWEALQVIERFGVSVASVVGWTQIVSATATPEQRFAIARDLKEAIKARFEPETWQRVAQPIFNKLRQRQRDALVAHVIHQRGFARMEQLYEYFLIDPGMEPVVQTSRIRLAIASVQLFIQRCLLNLEKQVHPSVINARQWEWMKRYRVWEANRKIFLFPENWLEPEFRDDKTHLFSELEGNLLQGDVSSDLVEDAFLNYLKKLEELARLDIVAMHLEDKADSTLNTLHVIGRTYSQPYKYFYRRYAHQIWTPWEPVTAEIEGDHLAPVVWRDRLYLFWVTFMDKPNIDEVNQDTTPNSDTTGVMYLQLPGENPAAGGSAEGGMLDLFKNRLEAYDNYSKPTGGSSSKKLVDVTMSEMMADLKSTVQRKVVEVQLHWSENLQGEWSTRESGSFPASISKIVDSTFDPGSAFIHVSKEQYENGEERGVYIHLGGAIDQAFYLAGRNSIPEPYIRESEPAMPYSGGMRANRYSGKSALTVEFKRRITTEDGKPPDDTVETLPILDYDGTYTLLPCNNNITLDVSDATSPDASNREAIGKAIETGLSDIESLVKPLFYQNNAHTLFIEPNVAERTIEEWQDWVTRTPQPEREWDNPIWWDEFVLVSETSREKRPIDPRTMIWDSPESLIKMKTEQDWLINPGTGLLFEDGLISSRGRAQVAVLPTAEASDAIARGGQSVYVHTGSGLPPGRTLITIESDALGKADLVQAAGGVNVVGSSGFNSALAQNFNALNRSGFGRGNLDGRLIGR